MCLIIEILNISKSWCTVQVKKAISSAIQIFAFLINLVHIKIIDSFAEG